MPNSIVWVKFEYYLVSLSLTVVNFLFGYAYVAFMSQSGLKDYEIGSILTLWSTILLLTGIPFGFLADRFSPKLMLGIGNLLGGAGYILYGFSKSLPIFLIAIACIALSQSMISRLPISWLIATMKQNSFLEETSIIPKGESLSKIITFFLGVLLSVILPSHIDSTIYFANGIISILLALFIFIFLSGSKNQEKTKNASLNILHSFLINVIRNRQFSIFCIKFLLFALAGQIFVYSWQLYTINELGVKSSYLGIMYSSFLLALALGYYLVSVFQKYIKVGSCIFIGTIIVLVSFALMYLFKNDWMFFVSCLIFEFGLGLEQGAGLVWIQSKINDASRSTALSALSTIIGVAGILATTLITYLLKASSYNSLWLVCSVLVFLSLLTLLLLFMDTRCRKYKPS